MEASCGPISSLPHAVDLDQRVRRQAPKGQLYAAMVHLQGLGQDSSTRWKAVSEQDEDSYPSSSLLGPCASKPTSPVLSFRQRSIYPAPDLPPIPGSDSMPVHGTEASDVSTLPENTNPFGHIRSSMGRLTIQSSEGISRKMPLRVIREIAPGENVEGDSGHFELANDDNTRSVSIPETQPPISIRSHIAAQLKAPDQNRNGMRIRGSPGFGLNETPSPRDRRTMRRGDMIHYSPTILKEMENDRRLPDHENMISSTRQPKQIPGFRGSPMFPAPDVDLRHTYGPPSQKCVTIHCCP